MFFLVRSLLCTLIVITVMTCIYLITKRLHRGVISNVCNSSHAFTTKNTTLTYNSANDNVLTAEIYWIFVNTSENFQVFKAVVELKQLDLDCIVIAANIHIIDSVRSLARLPVIDWGKDKQSNLTTKTVTPDGCQMTSTVGPTQSSGCLKPTGSNQVFREPIFQNETGVSLTLLAVISYLKWSSVNILYDKNTEYEAGKLHDRLSSIGKYAVLYNLEDMSSERIDHLMTLKSKAHDETSLNVTILCRLESCTKYMAKPFDYSRKHTVRSSLVHNSKWLLGIFHDGDLSSLESNSTELDNVAVIQYPTSFLNVPYTNDIKLEQAVKDIFSEISFENITDSVELSSEVTERLYDFDSSDIEECTWMPIKTLMWVKGRKRSLSIVGHTQITGSLYAQKDIFPNVKMGFNKRKMKISTLPWPPFVSFDNVTGNYSGFTIDLLQELANGLNFTYEISRPEDTQWGIEQNGSWTGLVGQLQRVEVDMVAAPLTIQTDRERVMDFAHPYFYESTAILLKKPDPNATKWRTLIDPFSTTVLICIFVALPVSSFFLFFFEKNNPYYRHVEDRSKVRGLHHFSDSFWYMYGALLTQGGEHMADSTSGRTLLSFWWIFCIIMMATYSGNLIAFLTVTKDKLPFNNLAGLVAQDEYEWGTQGGTAFETVFKTSELPDYQLFWSKLVEFNRTDPIVLSGDGSLHVEKVKRGNYAYVGDKTFMELKTLNNCDLGISLTENLPLQYSIGLPNNSPHTKIFTDEIISIHESGLLQIWKTNHWPRPGFCKGSLLKEAKPITLIDVHSAFYIIAIGIFIGGISLCIEYFKHRYCKWKEENGKSKPKPEGVRHVRTNPRLDELVTTS